MATQTVRCPNCQTENTSLENYCRSCGTTLNDPFQDQQSNQNQQMQPQPNPASGKIPGADKKLLAGLLGIFLGGLGIHKFVLGYQQEGIILLSAQIISWILAIVSCGILAFLPLLVHVVGLIEGIIYLTKSDEEFVNTYITNKKPWF